MATLAASPTVDSFLSSASRQIPAGQGMGIPGPLVHVHIAHVTSFPIPFPSSSTIYAFCHTHTHTHSTEYCVAGNFGEVFNLAILANSV